MEKKDLSLHHLVRESSLKNNQAPALIMLHGYGSNENDLFSFAPELPKELFIISVKAPYALPPYGNAWYAINFDADENKFSDNQQARESRDKLLRFIEEVKQNYPVDAQNINLLGFSQGSILSYAVALSHPELIKSVTALSGYINEDILEKGYENNDFSQLSVYASHGSQDQVIPVNWARQIEGFLNKLGIAHRYSEFPVGHGVSPQNFFEVKDFINQAILKS